MTTRVTLLAILGLFLPAAAAAQPSEKDADAERLFREGQRLMEERRFGEACPKLEAAYRKDQQLGTLLNLAYCHKEQGAVWQAWLEFKEAELKAIEVKRADRREFAKQRMAELEKSLARVVVEPSSKVELSEVLVEERRIPDAEKGAVFAAEPGQRKLTFRAKGKKQATQLVTLVKGDRPQRVAVPDMEEQGSEPDEPAATDSDVTSPNATARRPAREGSTQRTVAFVLGGAGVVALTVGAVTGIMTLNNPCTDQKNLDDARAGRPSPCTVDESAKGDETGMISNITFIAGGAALIGAVVLYFTAPTAKASSGRGPRVVPALSAGWAGLHGTF